VRDTEAENWRITGRGRAGILRLSRRTGTVDALWTAFVLYVTANVRWPLSATGQDYDINESVESIIRTRDINASEQRLRSGASALTPFEQIVADISVVQKLLQTSGLCRHSEI